MIPSEPKGAKRYRYCRMVFLRLLSLLPDEPIVIAGCFSESAQAVFLSGVRRSRVLMSAHQIGFQTVTYEAKTDGRAAPACLKKTMTTSGRPEPSTGIPRKRKRSGRSGVDKGPGGRREVAGSGDRAAIGDRPVLRLGKAAECHANRETASTAFTATPTKDDTLALVPRDRRGASAGVAADLRRPATRLPHYAPCGVTTAERFHATGEWPVAGIKRQSVRLCACRTWSASDRTHFVMRYHLWRSRSISERWLA